MLWSGQKTSIWKFSRTNNCVRVCVHERRRINLYDMKNEAVILLCLCFFTARPLALLCFMHFIFAEATCMHHIIQICINNIVRTAAENSPEVMRPHRLANTNAPSMLFRGQRTAQCEHCTHVAHIAS